MKISFRLENMNDTRLMYQTSSKYPDHVAVMISLVPTFTLAQEKSETIATYAGELDEQDIAEDLESKYNFIFLIDRSGSMTLNNRMKITNEAIVLFLQSLPAGSKFGMQGFGHSHSWSLIEGKKIFDYTNTTKELAIKAAKNFAANLGGTEILRPLWNAKAITCDGDFKKRIFLLTDG